MRSMRSKSGAVPALPLAVLVGLVGLVGLGGCVASGPPPRVWAASVCSALTPWRDEISTLTTRAQQQTPASTTPEQAKENLVRMLQGARDASERARGKVVAAGVPEVDGGPAIADGVAGSLTKVRDAYGKAGDAVRDLSTEDPTAFYDHVSGVMVTLQQEYSASALDTSSLHSAELQQAFAEVPECL
ncbi:hypothetical protein KUA19_17450 [Catellatospora sp. NEAU-YM18]|nr:hypothetical protein [Catellatospora tritici]MBV1851925.1 hypothetical protein [Catellatospora tritici]